MPHYNLFLFDAYLNEWVFLGRFSRSEMEARLRAWPDAEVIAW